MTYNIHPIFVHFPIALLTLYSIIKILPLSKWAPAVPWRQVERVLLFSGVLGAFIASSTGEIAEHLVRPNHQLVETHSFFAGITTVLYGLLAGGEIIALLNIKIVPRLQNSVVSRICSLLERILCNPVLSIILALLGIFAITITGVLGGALVYGTTADPIAPFVLHLFGITL